MNKGIQPCQFWVIIALAMNLVVCVIILSILFNPDLIYTMMELKTRPILVPTPAVIVLPIETLTPISTLTPSDTPILEKVPENSQN